MWVNTAGASGVTGFAPKTITSWLARDKPVKAPFPQPRRILYRLYRPLSTRERWLRDYTGEQPRDPGALALRDGSCPCRPVRGHAGCCTNGRCRPRRRGPRRARRVRRPGQALLPAVLAGSGPSWASACTAWPRRTARPGRLQHSPPGTGTSPYPPDHAVADHPDSTSTSTNGETSSNAASTGSSSSAAFGHPLRQDRDFLHRSGHRRVAPAPAVII